MFEEQQDRKVGEVVRDEVKGCQQPLQVEEARNRLILPWSQQKESALMIRYSLKLILEF